MPCWVPDAGLVSQLRKACELYTFQNMQGPGSRWVPGAAPGPASARRETCFFLSTYI